MKSKKTFSVFLSLSLFFLLFLFNAKSFAGLFGGYVPEGKEIKDPYLEELFAPEFPYESIKIIATKEGKRYVVVKGKEKVTEKIRLSYEKDTLRKRGIVVFRSGSPRTNTLLISEMRLYRVASQKPCVVEYSEVKGDSLEKEPGVESVVRNQGKYLIIFININFGKTFKRIEIYPEKETKCPDPPFIGKYPKSKSISCKGGNQGISFVYVTKDTGQEVYDYYRERLKAHYKKVGFNFPEESWKFLGAVNNFGMQIKSSEVAKVGIYLDPLKKGTSIAASPLANGVLFHIEIIQIEPKPVIKDFSLIRIFYCTDPERISANIERMKKLYPEGAK
jgi:hypothetical protein